MCSEIGKQGKGKRGRKALTSFPETNPHPTYHPIATTRFVGVGHQEGQKNVAGIHLGKAGSGLGAWG